jgi:hypothetical protein
LMKLLLKIEEVRGASLKIEEVRGASLFMGYNINLKGEDQY